MSQGAGVQAACFEPGESKERWLPRKSLPGVNFHCWKPAKNAIKSGASKEVKAGRKMPVTETSAGIKIRDARPEDASEIARIFNQGVQDQLATFENTFARPEDRFLWIVARPTKFPVVVAQLKHTLVGWASLGPYSPKSCYNGIAELSIYIDRNYRSHGVGQLLMAALQEAAKDHGFYKLIGRLMADNDGSRKLCRSTGWREVGIYNKHAKLGGKWHDLVLVEYPIPENMK